MLVNIGDGRIIEMPEGMLRAPPPEPPVKRKHRPRNTRVKRVIVKHGSKQKYRAIEKVERDTSYLTNDLQASIAAVPGLQEWTARRNAEKLTLYRQGRLGVPNHLAKATADARWAEARRLARKDMENIKKKIVLTDAAEEALGSALETMRSPMSQQVKLQAAKLVLDFTMAKPVSKSEVTLNSAEEWLKKIAEDE